jgi:hypothetical protein
MTLLAATLPFRTPRLALLPEHCSRARWPGADGDVYDAEIYPLGITLPAVPAVFLLARPRCFKAHSWVALYVGQAPDIAAALRAALGHGRVWGYAVEQGMTAVHIVRVEGGAVPRCRVERDLVRSLLPSLNREIAASDGFAGPSVNLGVTM